MPYIQRQQLVSASIGDGMSSTANPNEAASSCFALLSDFAARLAMPELDADQSMQAWDDLLQTLKDTTSST